MCEHHHAAKHILCSQCDMLVALPRLCFSRIIYAAAVKSLPLCEYERRRGE